MRTTVFAGNMVKIPDTIAALLDLKPGAGLDWQMTDDGAVIVQKRGSRAEQADKLLGIGRSCLKPGDDPVADLIRARQMDDI